MIALSDHPDVLDEARRDPSLIPRVIEESLRYEPPVQSVLWNHTRDVDVDGVHIPKDAAVNGMWSSANRGPERFPDPDRFETSTASRAAMSPSASAPTSASGQASPEPKLA
jgi:cytochrome P450